MEIQGQIQIEEYIEIALRRKWFLIIPFVVSVIGVILALLFIPRMYKSTTVILIEQQKVPTTFGNSTVNIDVAERLNTVTKQVMSRTRLESVINKFVIYKKGKVKLTSEELVEMMRKNIEIYVKNKLNRFSIYYKAMTLKQLCMLPTDLYLCL